MGFMRAGYMTMTAVVTRVGSGGVRAARVLESVARTSAKPVDIEDVRAVAVRGGDERAELRAHRGDQVRVLLRVRVRSLTAAVERLHLPFEATLLWA